LYARSESTNLDFLRSCAIFFVVLFHILLYFQHTSTLRGRLNLMPVGHFGVLIFFVHTSLVLLFSLERQDSRAPGAPLFTPFIIRRIFRVYPLSILVVVLVELFRIPVGHLRDSQFSFVNLHVTGILSNIFLLQDLTHTESAIAPLWSLPYEMRMYLLLPLIYLLAKKWRSPLPLALLWILAVLVGSGSHYVERLGFPDWFIFAPCFMAGALAYKASSLRRLNLPAALWPIALALITLFYLRHDTIACSWWSCLALGLLLPQFREISTPLFRETFKHIARYSYSVYLTHFFFIWLAFDQLHRHSLWLRWFVFLFSTVVASALLYHYMEEPMIGLGHRLSNQLQKRRSIPVVAPAD
jgi:peptidoglycan/LPS O-acetylase OafA/YrhL